MRKRGLVWLALAAMLLVAASGCTKTGAFSTGTPSIQVSGINGTTPDTAQSVGVQVTPSQGGFDVQVAAMQNTPSVRTLFLGLDYDASKLHATNVLAAQQPDGGSLSLAVESKPGRIEFGIVPAGSALNTVNPGEQLLSFRLAPGALRSSSAAGNHVVTTRARNLALSQNVDGHWVLAWDYTNPGDTTQDGQVGIGDLTPLGANFGKSVSNHYDDPLRHVDCDGNGQVGISDLTPIGANFLDDVYSYKIQMSDDGQTGWITVGELILADQHPSASQTVRFEYTFGAQYVSGAWYRVRPQSHDLQFGWPSEAISESGRQIGTGDSGTGGGNYTVTVSVNGLSSPMRFMNGCRIVYPASFTYVTDSYNTGSPGGDRAAPDGIWGTFSTAILAPPESFLFEQDLGDGFKAMDFNVTPTTFNLPETPGGYGDLFNFQLKGDGSGAPLTVQSVAQTDDGIKRSYFSGADEQEHFFGNTLGFTVTGGSEPTGSI